MSSVYDIFCLNHHPAVSVLGDVHVSEWGDMHARIRADPEHTHHACDLIVARYSGSLVELICPSGHDHNRYGPGGRHSNAEVIDIRWARLLVAMIEERRPPRSVESALRLVTSGCWSVDRLTALAREIKPQDHQQQGGH